MAPGRRSRRIIQIRPSVMSLLAEAIGTTDGDFVKGLLDKSSTPVLKADEVDEAGLNFMLSVVKDVKPKDQLEAMLAAQMAAVHMATMTLARRLAQRRQP